MQHESDHFTGDWVEELTGQGRNKHEYIEYERRHSDSATRRKHNSKTIRRQAKRCKFGRRQQVQGRFTFL